MGLETPRLLLSLQHVLVGMSASSRSSRGCPERSHVGDPVTGGRRSPRCGNRSGQRLDAVFIGVCSRDAQIYTLGKSTSCREGIPAPNGIFCSAAENQITVGDGSCRAARRTVAAPPIACRAIERRSCREAAVFVNAEAKIGHRAAEVYGDGMRRIALDVSGI